jgi:hypothetical protein
MRRERMTNAAAATSRNWLQLAATGRKMRSAKPFKNRGKFFFVNSAPKRKCRR